MRSFFICFLTVFVNVFYRLDKTIFGGGIIRLNFYRRSVMLFNSYVFIIGFLPLTLVLYYLSARWFGSLCARCVLILASLFFYS